jgi:hypothetical protein
LPVGILAALGVEQLYRWVAPEAWLKKAVLFAIIFCLLSVEVVTYRPYRASIEAWNARIAALKSRLPTPMPTNALVFVTNRGNEGFYLPELDGMILAQDLNVPTLNGYSGNRPPGYLEASPCYSYRNRLNAYAAHRKMDQSVLQTLADRVITFSLTPCPHEPVIAFTGEISEEQVRGIHLEVQDVTIRKGQLEARIMARNTASVDFNTVSIEGIPVRLSWRFAPLSPTGARLAEPSWDPRQDLTWSIVPGGHAQVDLSTDLPKVAGNYRFEISLVQEGVFWFHDRGMSIPGIPITIDPVR